MWNESGDVRGWRNDACAPHYSLHGAGTSHSSPRETGISGGTPNRIGNRHEKTLLAAAGVDIFLVGGTAWAQVLEEVIVTAQRRQTGLQETPVAVSSFTGDDLLAFNMQNSQDIAAKTPNLYMVPSGGGVAMSQIVYIRGQGQNAVDITVDPSIGTYFSTASMSPRIRAR